MKEYLQIDFDELTNVVIVDLIQHRHQVRKVKKITGFAAGEKDDYLSIIFHGILEDGERFAVPVEAIFNNEAKAQEACLKWNKMFDIEP